MVRFMKTALLAAALVLPCAAATRAFAEGKQECKECDKGAEKCEGKKCDDKKCEKNGYTVAVEGMHCGACEAKVKKALKGIEGVKEVKACHKAGKACVVMADEKTALTKEAVEKALAGTSFKVGEVAKCEKCDGKKKEDKKD